MRKTAEFLASMGLLVLTVLSSSAHCLHAQNIPAKPITHPWDNEHLSADVRADLVLQAMTLEEKLSILHGQGMPFFVAGPSESNGGAGYTKAIPRLRIPRPTERLLLLLSLPDRCSGTRNFMATWAG